MSTGFDSWRPIASTPGLGVGWARQNASRAWRAGLKALQAGELHSAWEQFSLAAERDPGMADAHLGMHGLCAIHGMGDPGLALGYLLASRDRLGEESGRTSLGLASRYWPTPYSFHELRTPADVLRAGARARFDAGDLPEARRLLALAPQTAGTEPFADLLLAYVGLGERDMHGSLHLAQRHLHHEALGPEAELIAAMAMFELGMLEQAIESLHRAASQTPVPELKYECLLIEGRILRASGQSGEARRRFEEVFAFDVNFPGVIDELAEHYAVAPEDRAVPVEAGSPPRAGSTFGALTLAATTMSGRGRRRRRSEMSEESEVELQVLLQELDSFIGLAEVKDQVRRLCATVRADQRRMTLGLAPAPSTRHLLFLGPPGTGKTTVARLVGQIYRVLGVLESGHMVETSRVDLVGQHLGSTAIKTLQVCDEARDGVLFIDEAYLLAMDGLNGGDAFGKEAIGTILKRMEDERDRLVVIAAGYAKEMEKFLRSNTGLPSRFKGRLSFASYGAADLVAIGHRLAAQRGTRFTERAVSALSAAMQEITGEGRADEGGNGRIPRNVLEAAEEARDLRLSGDLLFDPRALVTVTEVDVETAVARYRVGQGWPVDGARLAG